jgi:excisionase family DNA binding protein
MKTSSSKKQGFADIAEPWVSIEPACRHLGISIPTMRRWIRDEIVKPKRTPGGHLRFRITDLDKLID